MLVVLYKLICKGCYMLELSRANLNSQKHPEGLSRHIPNYINLNFTLNLSVNIIWNSSKFLHCSELRFWLVQFWNVWHCKKYLNKCNLLIRREITVENSVVTSKQHSQLKHSYDSTTSSTTEAFLTMPKFIFDMPILTARQRYWIKLWENPPY